MRPPDGGPEASRGGSPPILTGAAAIFMSGAGYIVIYQSTAVAASPESRSFCYHTNNKYAQQIYKL